MKRKLTFAKESLKVLTKPELTQAAGGDDVNTDTFPSVRPFACTTAITCGCRDSVDFVCTTGGLSCLVACDGP